MHIFLNSFRSTTICPRPLLRSKAAVIIFQMNEQKMSDKPCVSKFCIGITNKIIDKDYFSDFLRKNAKPYNFLKKSSDITL